MNNRPLLEEELDAEEFLKYYYLKKELTDFCRKVGLQTSGGKIEITERIAHYLKTGERLRSTTKRISSSYVSGQTYITLESIIESNFKCSEQHRAFFKSEIGKGFTFNVEFQNWLKSNAGKTYKDAIEAYKEIKEQKKTNRTKIDKQFEYNTYIRDFFDDPANKGKPLKDAIACWKYKKSLPGSNKYEPEDLVALNRSEDLITKKESNECKCKEE